MILFHNWTKH